MIPFRLFLEARGEPKLELLNLYIEHEKAENKLVQLKRIKFSKKVIDTIKQEIKDYLKDIDMMIKRNPDLKSWEYNNGKLNYI